MSFKEVLVVSEHGTFWVRCGLCSAILVGWLNLLRMSRAFAWPLRPSGSKPHASLKCVALAFFSTWVQPWGFWSWLLRPFSSWPERLNFHCAPGDSSTSQGTCEVFWSLCSDTASVRGTEAPTMCWLVLASGPSALHFHPHLDFQLIPTLLWPQGGSRIDSFGSTEDMVLVFSFFCPCGSNVPRKFSRRCLRELRCGQV